MILPRIICCIYNTRSRENKHSSLGQRSITFKGSCLWNSLQVRRICPLIRWTFKEIRDWQVRNFVVIPFLCRFWCLVYCQMSLIVLCLCSNPLCPPLFFFCPLCGCLSVLCLIVIVINITYICSGDQFWWCIPSGSLPLYCFNLQLLFYCG